MSINRLMISPLARGLFQTAIAQSGAGREPGTPLARTPDRHPDDDVQAGRYETAERMLARAGEALFGSPTHHRERVAQAMGI